MGTASIQVQSRRNVFDRAGSRASSAVVALVPFALALAGALALQYFLGAYSVSVSSYPDEPAHVVTALMYREFLLERSSDPLQFAKNYYVHYPYLGAGHWPPMLHLSAAVWTIFTGVGRVQFMLYLALAAAASSALLYRSIRPIGSAWLAAAFVAVWILLEPTQTALLLFMTELPLACLTLAAIVAYVRYMRTPNYRLALLFAVLSAAAILTKEPSVALAAVPPLTVAATRRWDLFRTGHFWLPAAVVLALVGPWHLWIADLGIGRNRQGIVQRLFLQNSDTVGDRFELLVVLVGWPLLLLAAAGLAIRLRHFAKQGDSAYLWLAHASLLAGGLMILVLAPESREPRHLYHLVPSLLIFAAAAVWKFIHILRAPLRIPAVAALGVCCILFSPIGFGLARGPSAASRDASAIAQYVYSQPDARIVLISGGIGSEGYPIAEAALLEPAPVRYFVRASKTIYQVNWEGQDQRMFLETVPELANFIDSSGFDLIVRLPGDSQSPRLDEALLSQALAERPEQWVPVPLDLPGGSRIYRRTNASEAGLQPIRIQTSSRLGQDLVIETADVPASPR